MPNIRRVLILIFFGILLFSISCRIPFWPREHQILGVVGPETGPHSEMGVSIIDGIMLRAGEINKSGAKLNGDILSVVHYDDSNDPETCIKSVKRLLETDDAFAIIYYNPDGIAAAECAAMCAEADVPFVSLSGKYDPAANPVSVGGYELSPGDEEISTIGIDYVFARLSITNPALITIGDTPIPPETRTVLAEKLGEDTNFALNREIGRADIELISVSPDIKFSGADAVLVYSNAEDTFRLVRELEVDQIDIPVINIKPFIEPGVFDDEITLNRFIYFFTPLPDVFANAKSERFQRRFLEVMGYEPNYYSCIGYEAADFITHAVFKSESVSANKMKAEWDKIPVWEGILGNTDLKTGKTDFGVYIYTVSVIEGVPVIELETEL